jgi:hypothetical protein
LSFNWRIKPFIFRILLRGVFWFYCFTVFFFSFILSLFHPYSSLDVARLLSWTWLIFNSHLFIYFTHEICFLLCVHVCDCLSSLFVCRIPLSVICNVSLLVTNCFVFAVIISSCVTNVLSSHVALFFHISLISVLGFANMWSSHLLEVLISQILLVDLVSKLQEDCLGRIKVLFITIMLEVYLSIEALI